MAVQHPCNRVQGSEPDAKRVPDELVEHIKKKLDTLRKEWDKKHPENPIDSGDGSK